MWFTGLIDEEEQAMEEGLDCNVGVKTNLEEIKEANSDEEDEITMASGIDYDCTLFDIEIGETLYEQMWFIAPFDQYDGSFSFNPSDYKKTELDEYDDIEDEFVRYDFGNLEDDYEEVMLSVVVSEDKAEELEDYLGITEKEEKITVENVPYLSQQNSEETYNKTGCSDGCCGAASKWMVSQTGTSIDNFDRIYFKTANNIDDLSDGVSTNIGQQEFENTVSYVKESLKAGKPVFFGTWDNRSKNAYNSFGPEAYNFKPNGSVSPTTHFMVIVEYGFDKTKNKYYFRFYDPGRGNESLGTSKQNKLIIDENKREIYINNYRNKNYKLTEIRKNE